MFSGMELLKALKISLIVNGYRPLIVNGYRMRSGPRRVEEPISCVKAVNHTLVYGKRNTDFERGKGQRNKEKTYIIRRKREENGGEIKLQAFNGRRLAYHNRPNCSLGVGRGKRSIK